MVLALPLLLACTDDPPRESGPNPTTPGGVFSRTPTLTANANPDAPLAWRLEAALAEPGSVHVTVTDAVGSWTRGPFAGPEVDAWLFRWHPGESHEVQITATSESGAEESVTLTVDAPALPDDFPPITVVTTSPDDMEPGFTVFAPSRLGPDAPQYLLAVDAFGLPVWWYASENLVYGLERTSRGIRYALGKTEVREVDLLGALVHRIGPEPAKSGSIGVPYVAVHHDAFTLPDGNVLILAVESRTIPNFPLDEQNLAVRGDAFVAGDVLLELDGVDGQIVREWHLLDLLQPDRIGYDVLTEPYWNATFDRSIADWSHTNAIAFEPEADRIWLSLRHQDALVGLGRFSGELELILGNDDRWSAPWSEHVVGLVDGKWMYHQHGVHYGGEANLFVFDNGNNRATPPEPPVDPTFSRAVEYRYDAVSRTAEEVWSYEDPRDLYAQAFGNVQFLPGTDHVLVLYGDLSRSYPGAPTARILELTHEPDPAIVFELALFPEFDQSDRTAFRAHRWPEW
jgi:hypothetical protein